MLVFLYLKFDLKNKNTIGMFFLTRCSKKLLTNMIILGILILNLIAALQQKIQKESQLCLLN